MYDKKPKDSKSYNGPKGHYDLSLVKQKIKAGEFLIKENAKISALRDFGWRNKEIARAFTKLKLQDFYKSDSSQFKYLVIVDVYKAHIEGYDIYTHFYIEAEQLIINSFKKL